MGKSTLIHRLKQNKTLNSIVDIHTFQEPMKYWAKPLQLLYKDPRRWTYNFQKAVWMHYFKVQRQIALLTDSKNESALKVIIIERDPHSAVEVFCKLSLIHI